MSRARLYYIRLLLPTMENVYMPLYVFCFTLKSVVLRMNWTHEMIIDHIYCLAPWARDFSILEAKTHLANDITKRSVEITRKSCLSWNSPLSYSSYIWFEIICWDLNETSQVSSMIHSARPTVSSVANIVFTLFC